MSIWNDVAASARDVFYTVGGASVAYSRGDDSVSLVAIPRDMGREALADGALVIAETDRAYQIKTDDLVLDGENVLPARGDLIEETVNGETQTYEVFPRAREEPCFEYAGPDQEEIVVHVKLRSRSDS